MLYLLILFHKGVPQILGPYRGPERLARIRADKQARQALYPAATFWVLEMKWPLPILYPFDLLHHEEAKELPAP